MDEPLKREGLIMNQHPPQAPFCEQEDSYSVDQAPGEEQACETAPEWAGLRPELLDRVLDP